MKPRTASSGARPAAALLAVMLLGLAGGCAGPGPHAFPDQPLRVVEHADGRKELWFDADRDQQPDAIEVLGPAGVLIELRYDTDRDGVFETIVDRSPAADRSDRRHLLVVLDSVPYEVVAALWDEGHLRMFPRPTRTIAPFPVMTDVSLSRFFGVGPCPGMEATYYNGKRRVRGLANYLAEGNSPWLRRVDFHLPAGDHAFAYLAPPGWFGYELRAIQDGFVRSGRRFWIGYCVGTSAWGMSDGREAHRDAMLEVERFCRWLLYRTGGQIEITLMSDHGHDLRPGNHRLNLKGWLREHGFRVVREWLERDDDVLVPEFGVVSCAGIYTHRPARVARTSVLAPGVELATWRDDAGVHVVRRPRNLPIDQPGRGDIHNEPPEIEHAVITRRDGQLRYQPLSGDPLDLAPVVEALRQRGQLDADGFASDEAWFERTRDRDWPDAVYRLWRAFDGLMQYPPDVICSLDDRWYHGNPKLASRIRVESTHGNLRTRSSCGFAMTTAGELPEVLRIEDLPDALRAAGVPIDWQAPGRGGAASSISRTAR